MMAEALIGGSLLSASLQVLFDRIASRDFLDFFKRRKRSDKLLDKLKIIMISVNGVLDDAEKKQITTPAVKEWLDELKDAVYQTDDLLDEIAYEALRSKLEVESQTSLHQVKNLFSSINLFKKGLEVKLNEIIERLDFLVKQKDALGLKEDIGFGEQKQKRMTTCLIDASEIYGRDDNKETMMKLLLSDDPNGNDVGVIPIVGMGGVGKTALAQLLFNDSRVEEWFDIRTWVCVSEDFDAFKITRNIVEEIKRERSENDTLNQLQLELSEKLTGKRFLLVLDDVWNEQYTDWDILRRPLKAGAQGSKIIVTTRIERVALVMRTIPSHLHLKELSYDDSWFVFAKHAFDDGNSGAHPDLEVIGRDIVRKCKGLPLAAKTLGGLLRSMEDVEEWERILKSNIWDVPDDKILPALRLSYHYLPSQLKRCFAYCAIFPKDYKFQKRELVLLWMAEGLLVQLDENMEMEEIGYKHFNDLVSRSFFQQSSVFNSNFVMHHLINDLARFVSGEFCCCLEDENSYKITRKTRHFLNAAGQHGAFKKIEDGVYEASNLHTFLSMNHIDNEVVHKLLPKLKLVRAIRLLSNDKMVEFCSALPFNDNMVEFLDSIGDCKRLRYLNLQIASIQRLPQSVTSLYNLQTLNLSRCWDLIELPVNMRMLVNLRHLVLPGFIKVKFQSMPPDMGKLTKLQTLTDFVLGKSNGSRLKEFGKLQQLRGKLSIHSLQNVTDAHDALEANLKCKKHIKNLWLNWGGDTSDSQHERCILKSLEPHSKIEVLSIYGYGGTKFPKWVGDPSFSYLTSLTLHGCGYCSSLPPVGQLVSLKYLSIGGFKEIVVVGPEFYGTCISTNVPFGFLETLRFSRMPQWQEWISCDQHGAFPLLQKLDILSCPKLKKSLPNHLPSLSTLKIDRCEQLVDSLPKAPNMLQMMLNGVNQKVLLKKFRLEVSKFPSLNWLEHMVDIGNTLEEIDITYCDSLKCFPVELFPNIKRLHIRECQNLESLSEATEATHRFFTFTFTSLSSVTIYDCHNLVSFPRGGLFAPSLTSLLLRNCSSLKSLPDHMHSLLVSLVNLKIDNCPELESFPEGGLPFKLESLVIIRCSKLIAGRMQWDLQKLPSLLCFSIGEDPDMESFPEETLLPSAVTNLDIAYLDNLKSLEYKGLHHLTSLRELKIRFCPKLQSITEEGLPSSLSSLVIYHCPELESFPKAGLPLTLESLEIICCNKLISGRMHWNLQNLQHLLHFSIAGCENVESFPEERLLPSSLSSLKIWRLQNLKSINCKGLQHLTSLRKLEMLNCIKLQSMPEQELPPSISSLIIKNCPLLKRRRFHKPLTLDTTKGEE